MSGQVMLLNKGTNCGGGRFGRLWGAGGAPATTEPSSSASVVAHARGDKA
jgi:hypothetical protein